MSGRLIILPKKSYCPWNPANVERVLKDERLEKERSERERAEHRNHESRERLKTLKHCQSRGNRVQDQSPQGSTEMDQPQQQHVNLFEKEERATVEQALNPETIRNIGIMPVILGETELRNRGENRPFYLRSTSRTENGVRLSRKEEQRKARMDPMQVFVRNDEEPSELHFHNANKRNKSHHCNQSQSGDSNECASSNKLSSRSSRLERERTRQMRQEGRRRRRRNYSTEGSEPSDYSDNECASRSQVDRQSKARRNRKEKKQRRSRNEESTVSEATSSTGTMTFEELRRRRKEREERESQRQAMFLAPQKSATVNTQSRKYYDQYNPGLSRR